MTYYSRVQAHVFTKKIIIINAYLSCECDIEREKEKKKKKGVRFWWLSKHFFSSGAIHIINEKYFS